MIGYELYKQTEREMPGMDVCDCPCDVILLEVWNSLYVVLMQTNVITLIISVTSISDLVSSVWVGRILSKKYTVGGRRMCINETNAFSTTFCEEF